ncbi:MAG: bifunctional DNA-formamidopyrimidine glycosylase/DNA-(apurinic or apyrimidinic site) lyase [Acidimicrobiales bacterium]
MPELPEVETVRSDLAGVLPGRRVRWATVTGARSLRHTARPELLASSLVGSIVRAVGRRGKLLLLELDSPAKQALLLVVHLGMSGQLCWIEEPGQLAPARHTHARIGFRPGGELRFVDPRTFGWIALADAGEAGRQVPLLGALGPEPLGRLGPAGLWRLLARRRGRLKAVLMDQHVLAGIGNIYSDEILHAARLRWDRAACSLDVSEVRRLHRAMRSVLREAVAARGSTLGDQQYRDLFGEAGSYQSLHGVYGREGLPCPRCGAAVVRERFAGRSTFSCPRCQLPGPLT